LFEMATRARGKPVSLATDQVSRSHEAHEDP
jgi:hypothetical protein